MVVGFYDIQNQDELKAVPRLRVVGAGQNSTVPTFSDRTDQRTVNLPLKTNEQSTEFFFIRESASDSSGAETGNIDNIQFTYQTNQVFVSRGCGYAVNYSSLDAIQNPGQNDPDSWISALLVEQQQISNQDTVHVKIFH
nr:DUF6452 family protein [Robertkochia sp. 3YJGBD-33]